MPACELVQTVRGRSSAARWRAVSVQTGYAVGILVALTVTGWLAGAALGFVIDLTATSPELAEARRVALSTQLKSVAWSWTAWIGAATLAAVVVAPALLSLALNLYDRRRVSEEKAAKAVGLPDPVA